MTEEQLNSESQDIAERLQINRFTTAEVKIDMTGMTNRIDGSADLDGVISQLTEEALLRRWSPLLRGCTHELFLLSGRRGVAHSCQAFAKIKGKIRRSLLNEGEINFLRTPGLSEIVLPVTLSMLTGSRSDPTTWACWNGSRPPKELSWRYGAALPGWTAAVRAPT